MDTTGNVHLIEQARRLGEIEDEQLVGHSIMIELMVDLSPTGDGKVRPSVACALTGEGGRDRVKLGALVE